MNLLIDVCANKEDIRNRFVFFHQSTISLSSQLLLPANVPPFDSIDLRVARHPPPIVCDGEHPIRRPQVISDFRHLDTCSRQCLALGWPSLIHRLPLHPPLRGSSGKPQPCLVRRFPPPPSLPSWPVSWFPFTPSPSVATTRMVAPRPSSALLSSPKPNPTHKGSPSLIRPRPRLPPCRVPAIQFARISRRLP